VNFVLIRTLCTEKQLSMHKRTAVKQTGNDFQRTALSLLATRKTIVSSETSKKAKNTNIIDLFCVCACVRACVCVYIIIYCTFS
jgi:hypothetical protein